jgi:hypothetical protein
MNCKAVKTECAKWNFARNKRRSQMEFGNEKGD